MTKSAHPNGNGDNPSLLVEIQTGFSKGRSGQTDFWVHCEFGDKKDHQIRLDQYYGEFINTLIRASKDAGGRNRIYLTLNPAGDRQTLSARLVLADEVEAPLPLSRIIMNAQPDELIFKTGSPVDYRAQSFRRELRATSRLNRTRELLFEKVRPIVGDESTAELQSIIAIADSLHRMDVSKITVTPSGN